MNSRLEKVKTALKNNPWKGEIDLTTGNLFKKMLIFTVPILLLALLQLLYSSMDQLVVSNWGGGSQSFDAIGSNNSLINLLVGLFVGVSVGANVVVAKAVGGKDKVTAHRAIQSAMLLSLIFGVAVAAIGIAFAEPLLRLMQTPESYLNEAAVYLRWYFGGMPFLMIFNFGAACLRAMGDSKRPLYALLACALLNVGLNFLLVAGLGMKENGADVFAVGLTTVISEAVAAVLIVCFISFNRKAFASFSLKEWHLYEPETRAILHNGIPAGLQSFVFSFSNVFIQASVNDFADLSHGITNEIAVAGNSASIQIEGYIWIVMNAFSTAVVAIVAQNLAAGKKENITKALWMSLVCSTVLGLGLGGLAVLLYSPLLGIFLPESAFKGASANADWLAAMEVGRQRLLLIGLTYFLDGWMDNTSGFCRGLGHPKTPTIITFLAVTLFRILFITLVWRNVAYFHTLPWLWSTWPISWVLAVASYYVFVPSYIKKAFKEIDLRQIQTA